MSGVVPATFHRSKPNQAGYPGVTPTSYGKFRARVCVGNVDYELGFYDDPAEAHERYVAKRAELVASYLSDRAEDGPDCVTGVRPSPRRLPDGRPAPTARSTTGYRGVAKRANGRFYASVTLDGIRHNRGSFPTAAAAGAAYQAMLDDLLALDMEERE